MSIKNGLYFIILFLFSSCGRDTSQTPDANTPAPPAEAEGVPLASPPPAAKPSTKVTDAPGAKTANSAKATASIAKTDNGGPFKGIAFNQLKNIDFFTVGKRKIEKFTVESQPEDKGPILNFQDIDLSHAVFRGVDPMLDGEFQVALELQKEHSNDDKKVYQGLSYIKFWRFYREVASSLNYDRVRGSCKLTITINSYYRSGMVQYEEPVVRRYENLDCLPIQGTFAAEYSFINPYAFFNKSKVPMQSNLRRPTPTTSSVDLAVQLLKQDLRRVFIKIGHIKEGVLNWRSEGDWYTLMPSSENDLEKTGRPRVWRYLLRDKYNKPQMMFERDVISGNCRFSIIEDDVYGSVAMEQACP